MSFDSRPCRVGDLLKFQYPVRNVISCRREWKQRTIIVESVIDTSLVPVETRAFELRPLIRRGRWLIIGYDCDRGGLRKFYREAMRDVNKPAWLQLGLYDPCDEDDVWHPQLFPVPPIADARKWLAEVLRHYNRRTDTYHNLGVFPVSRAKGLTA